MALDDTHAFGSSAPRSGSDPRAAASRPSALRQAAVWELVQAALADVMSGDIPPTVLDCGGGTGTLAVPLAQIGAEVTVLDVSIDALATLNRRALEAGVSERVRAVQGDLEAPEDAALEPYPTLGYDLVLAHGVLETLASGSALATAIEFLSRSVRPGGLVSIVVSNPVSTVLARVLSGEVAAALDELRSLAGFSSLAGTPSVAGATMHLARLGISDVTRACVAAGLVVEQLHGVGVFTELIPGGEIDGLPYGAEVVSELESLGAQLPPFRDIAARLRVLARKPTI